MPHTSSLVKALGLAAMSARTVLADCLSYGMDFQNGGSYFQNSLSNDNFTFVSQFDGCNSDTCFNVFVNPDGVQSLCSDTQLTPDDTNQLSTCPDLKSSLSTGDYSVVLFSNNGNGTPIAYQRDFHLSVGPQSTSTFTPTVIVTSTSTPLVNTTVTTTDTVNTTLPAQTITSPSATITPTTTVTPARVTSTSTKTLATIKINTFSVSVAKETKTVTASCKLPTKPSKWDPVARIKPTVGPYSKIINSKYRREVLEEERRRFVQERTERMDLVRRAPDPQPLIVTDTNTADYPTSTTVVTGPAVTATVTTEVTTTATITPSPVVVLNGKTTAARVTVTAPTPTKIVTRYTIAKTTSTQVMTATIVIQSTTTPAAVAASCSAAGGTLQGKPGWNNQGSWGNNPNDDNGQWGRARPSQQEDRSRGGRQW
ncbi:unnamed protein product [Periconia digitata]|uniref:Uncharacterized protein n=1 Tax=Periconia digitata TaxID=1303443 RepID=A0A9W4U6W2_9PLEO|nr:unnamed protein product [Periconia digitata]